MLERHYRRLGSMNLKVYPTSDKVTYAGGTDIIVLVNYAI
jgi:hypothetical protein